MYKNTKITTPVVLIIFNRPELTKRIFQEIRNVKPTALYVIADGPRKTRPGENERCILTRNIIETVDWECKVYKNYSDVNLGCKKRISSGISWVFENTEEAIILEDDCLPHLTFFQYCEELLQKYREDERVMMISGNNFFRRSNIAEYSYYFTSFNHIWGWATWRRAWQHYDLEMKKWPKLKNSGFLLEIVKDPKSVHYWNTILQEVYDGKINTWAYQWLFAGWVNNKLNIIPSKNLISNIGFGVDSTHTAEKDHPFSNLPLVEMEFPLSHPPEVIRNMKTDLYETKTVHRFGMREKFVRFVKKLLRIY
ncbi:MAG: hypothetical protein V3V72_11645 [Ignavibacteriaceae bacterium]|jgi:hypothetical protein